MHTIYTWFAKHFNHVLIKSLPFGDIGNEIGVFIHRCRACVSDMPDIALTFVVSNFKNFPFSIVGKVSDYPCHTKTISHRKLSVNHNGYGFPSTLCRCYPLKYGEGILLYSEKGKAKNG